MAIDVQTPPTVKVTGIVRAPIAEVWKLFRPFGKEIMNWWPIYVSAELEAPGVDQIGVVRRIKTTTGRTYEEKLVERDDTKYHERYDMLSVEPSVPTFNGAVTIVEMSAQADGSTQVLWQSWSDASSLLLRSRSNPVQALTYIDAIADLDRHFNPALGTLEVTVVSTKRSQQRKSLSDESICRHRTRQREAGLDRREAPHRVSSLQCTSFSLPVLSNHGNLRIAVWDAHIGRDISLGAVEIDCHSITSGNRSAQTLDLVGSEGAPGGSIQIELLLSLKTGGALQLTEAEQKLSNLAAFEGVLAKLQKQALQIAQQIGKGPRAVWEYGRYDRNPQLPDVPLELLPRTVVGLPPDQALAPHKVAQMLERGIEYVYNQANFLNRATQAGADPYLAYFGPYVAAPEHIVAHWKDDAELARQFIQGVGPMVIERVTDISRLPESLQKVLPGGESLTQLIADRRLFILDYVALTPLKPYRDMVFYAPYVLVYKEKLEGGDRLNLAAIQLTRYTDRPNAVYTPQQTPPNRWLFAKMHAACADNQYHQWLFHLGYAHLAMEPSIVAWHNALPKDHVISQLLAPHTRDTIGINFLARQTLVSDIAPFTDRTFSTGTAQALQMFLGAWQKYDFFARSFPSDLEARGFNEAVSDGLEGYYYRDDGFLIWNALGEYVRGVVEASYADDAAVVADAHIQAWAKESSDADKAAIPGFPATIGGRDLLIRTLQNLIWLLSAQHAVVNFSQYHFLSYVPNRPDSLFAQMPDGDDEIGMDLIQNALPNPIISHFQISFAWLLSMPSDYPLTSVSAMAERLPDVHKRFMQRLQEASASIGARNQKLVEQGARSLSVPPAGPDRLEYCDLVGGSLRQ